MNSATLTLLVLAAGIATAYGLWGLHGPVSHFRAVFKSTPLVLLTVAAIHSGAPMLLIAAFAFCFLGDWCLAFEGDGYFIAGLGSFLLAHLAYSALFLSRLDAAEIAPDFELFMAIAVLAIAIALVNFRLWPHTGQLRFPVLIYSLIIALMAISARVSEISLTVQIGIVMFIVSDIILSREKFLPDGVSWWDRNSSSLVWWLYIGGQLLIAAGLLLPGLET